MSKSLTILMSILSIFPFKSNNIALYIWIVPRWDELHIHIQFLYVLVELIFLSVIQWPCLWIFFFVLVSDSFMWSRYGSYFGLISWHIFSQLFTFSLYLLCLCMSICLWRCPYSYECTCIYRICTCVHIHAEVRGLVRFFISHVTLVFERGPLIVLGCIS